MITCRIDDNSRDIMITDHVIKGAERTNASPELQVVDYLEKGLGE